MLERKDSTEDPSNKQGDRIEDQGFLGLMARYKSNWDSLPPRPAPKTTLAQRLKMTTEEMTQLKREGRLF